MLRGSRLLVAVTAAAVVVPAGVAAAAQGGGGNGAARGKSPVSTVAAALASDVCTALEAPTRQADPQLGAGLTVSTGQADNLFVAGTTPALSVTATGVVPSAEGLRLSVRDRAGVVTATDIALADGTQSVPLPATPGWFKVLAERHVGAHVLGATCLWYGVAPGGTALDPAQLPAGADWGGPGALRDVALHAQLGLPVVRRQIDVAQFLANPVGDPQLAAAAEQAAAQGLRFVVQIGQGGAAETAAVADGTWEDVVRRIVAANPAVHRWEAWNEPNTAMFFSGTVADYVTKVLVPFARAVRAADPAAQVVGGSALADDAGWWRGFARLGGFRVVDAIGVHPYTWSWGAPETQGLRSVLTLVKKLAVTSGGRGKPILDTESGFPSAWQGVDATIWTQADFVARKLVLEKALGVQSGEFLVEGGWQDWSIIDATRGVKPAAITTASTTAQLAGRRFLGWFRARGARPSVAARGVLVARFGPSATDRRGLSVVWSTGAPASVTLRCTATGHDAFGAPVVASRSLTATGSPVFLAGATAKAAGCVAAVAKTGKKHSAAKRKAASRKKAARKRRP